MIKTRHQYANAAIGNDSNVLQDIHISSKNIAIYRRDIEPLEKELDQIAEQPVECRAKGTVEEIVSVLKDYFDSALPQCSSLFKDVSELLGMFERTTKSSSFNLLLTTVSTNMCRKFHTDINDLRMLCTYIGPGTHWLPDEAIDHEASRANRNKQEIIMDEQQIQQVGAGDVIILKGGLYPDANPILHRSPTIEESGEKRLLLRIDTNEFLNFLT